MPSGIGESANRQPQGSNYSPSSSAGGGSNEAGNFECNICLDLAQDPIVTLCGHLFCWPCLYKWLHVHTQSQGCPVCKAIIQEEKLVPLYGRGKNYSDPRSRSVPGVEIPHRPTGRRPETARGPPRNQFPQQGFGFVGGFPPMATSRLGNFAFAAGFGGLFPSLFNFHMHGYPDANPYGTAPGFPYGFTNSYHGGHVHGVPQHRNVVGQQPDSNLSTLFLLVGILVVAALICM